MKKVMNEIIDADLYLSVPSSGKKSAVKVSVPHNDEIFDADEAQLAKFTIKPRVIEEVICA